MDFETQRKKRLEALEEKKKRLEEMKKLKQEREAQSNTSVENTNLTSSKERNDVDDLVNSLLLSSNEAETSQDLLINHPQSAVITPPNQNTKTNDNSNINKFKSHEISIVKKVVSFEVFPNTVESYEKECQTDELPNVSKLSVDTESNDSDENNYNTGLTPQKLSHRRQAAAITVSTSLIKTASSQKTNSGSPKNLSTVKAELNESEIKCILKSDIFAQFMSESSHIVERAIGQSNMFDLLRDYKRDRLSEQNGSKKGVVSVGAFLDESVRNRPIMDIQFSPHFPELFLVAYGAKTVYNSAQQKKVANSSFQSDHDHEPLGMVCVWSTGVDSKPEFKFTSTSPVLSARFSATDEHIIIGGCYTGQLLMWDMRAKSQPIQRSSLTGKGHKHPIYSMSFVPSVTLANAASVSSSGLSSATSVSSSTTSSAPTALSFDLVTVSVDGVLCYWDVSRLVEPSNIINLATLLTHQTVAAAGTDNDTSTSIGSSSGQLPLNITCMSYSSSLFNSQVPREVIFGSGTGQLYRGSVPLRPNQMMSQIEAHTGLVSSMQVNPNPQRQYKNLLLSSSLDWSIKLWNVIPPDDRSTMRLAQSRSDNVSHLKPLLEFITPTCNYVSDVQWCPTNPALFSTITSCGHLSLWNLCRSVSEPVETVFLSNDKVPASEGARRDLGAAVPSGGIALNKSVWSNNGRMILIGDSKGCVHMVTVQENITTFSSSDENKFEILLLGNNVSIAAASGNVSSDFTLPSSVEDAPIDHSNEN